MFKRFQSPALAGLSLALPFVALPGLAAAETDVLYGSFAPATSAFSTGYLQPWIDAITTATDGSVQFNYVPGGGVVDMRTAVSGIRDGVVDGAFYVTVSYASDLPVLFMLSELIGLGQSNAARLGAFNEFVIEDCPECQAELAGWNQQFLGGYSLGDYYLFCTRAVTTPEDFNGLRIRAIPPYSRLFGAVGDVVPVTVSLTESYEALQRGQVDCHAGPASTYVTYSFIDIADHVVELSSGASFGGSVFAFSRDKWAEFTPEERQAILRATAEATAHGAIAYAQEDAAALEAARAQGSIVAPVDDAVQAALAGWIAENGTGAAQRAAERGVTDAQDIVDRFLPYIDRWNALLPRDEDEAAIAEVLWTEIYATYPSE
ncbi:C4-dicarboxylate TRAP transporter substrate-binding protein [Pararhodobacter aggregans]|uniref:C4-dicarboxylate TRAP transporter substrate-binding protein n=1 Tax=Pararhodobacter aggregans TaxID=404875 RepID=UPI003A8E7758